MYIRSSSVTRKTTRGDLAASASPLGPGQPTCQAYRRRGSAASPARCCRCRACTRAGTAPSSSSARSTWAYVTRSSPRASRAAPAGSMGSMGDRRSSPCPRRPRARDFFIQPVQQESTTVQQSETVSMRSRARNGVGDERAGCAPSIQNDLARRSGPASAHLIHAHALRWTSESSPSGGGGGVESQRRSSNWARKFVRRDVETASPKRLLTRPP